MEVTALCFNKTVAATTLALCQTSVMSWGLLLIPPVSGQVLCNGILEFEFGGIFGCTSSVLRTPQTSTVYLLSEHVVKVPTITMQQSTPHPPPLVLKEDICERQTRMVDNSLHGFSRCFIGVLLVSLSAGDGCMVKFFS